jgi:hypothetical protein
MPEGRGLSKQMADYFGLRRWTSSSSRENEQEQWQRVSAQLSALQRDVQEIKRMLAVLTSSGGSRSLNGEQSRLTDRPALAAEREEAIDLLVALVQELRERGASRLFSNVHEEIRLRYGELPNERIPYERFKDYVQDAQRRGRIRLVRVGAVDHLLLADEPIQSYVEAVRREGEGSSLRER